MIYITSPCTICFVAMAAALFFFVTLRWLNYQCSWFSSSDQDSRLWTGTRGVQQGLLPSGRESSPACEMDGSRVSALWGVHHCLWHLVRTTSEELHSYIWVVCFSGSGMCMANIASWRNVPHMPRVQVLWGVAMGNCNIRTVAIGRSGCSRHYWESSEWITGTPKVIISDISIPVFFQPLTAVPCMVWESTTIHVYTVYSNIEHFFDLQTRKLSSWTLLCDESVPQLWCRQTTILHWHSTHPL